MGAIPKVKGNARKPFLIEHRRERLDNAIGLLLLEKCSTSYVTERAIKFKEIQCKG